MVVETSRRTIFLANLVNFLSNRDHKTGKQSPWYEPLDNELILSMPLPCSHALWNARAGNDWLRLARRSDILSSATNEKPDGCEDLERASASLLTPQVSLRALLLRFSAEYLRGYFGSNFGFEDSDALRRLIVLCGLEQFS